MSARIPIAPLILGLAGLIPFLWGAASLLWPEQTELSFRNGLIIWNKYGHEILIPYGVTILAFMSGVLWGFAARSTGGGGPIAARGYALSVLPALWGFAVILCATGATACAMLAAGFCALLLLDLRARHLSEAPDWWLKLRLILTTVAVTCLLVGTFA